MTALCDAAQGCGMFITRVAKAGCSYDDATTVLTAANKAKVTTLLQLVNLTCASASSMMWDGRIDTTNPNGLGGLAVNISRAIAVLNVGSWDTYIHKVVDHTPGSMQFTYAGTVTPNKFMARENRFFLESKLELLDAEEEWFYDATTSKVYVWLSGAADPALHTIRGKVQDYAIKIVNGASHIRVENVNFFGTTLYASRDVSALLPVTYIDVVGVTFKYPSCSKRMLGSTAAPLVTELSGHGYDSSKAGKPQMWAGCWAQCPNPYKGHGCCRGFFKVINCVFM